MRLIVVLASSVALLLGGAGAPAQAAVLPTGFTLVSGTVTASYDAATAAVTLEQSSATAIVHFQAADIGAGATVRVKQPAAGSRMLIRVVGGAATFLAGSLQADGQVVLVNPAGITVDRGAYLRVGGVVLSSMNTQDVRFLGGGPTFDAPGPTGPVTTAGTIRADRGIVALLGTSEVTNSGSVVAPGGVIGMVASSSVGVSLGSRNAEAIAPAQSAGSQPAAVVSSSGILDARGGAVRLHGDRAGSVTSTGVVLSSDSALTANSVEIGGVDRGPLHVACTLGSALQSRVTLNGVPRKPEHVTTGTFDKQKVLYASAFAPSGGAAGLGRTSCSAGVLNAPVPSLVGTPAVGRTLASSAAWAPSPARLAYQWLRDGRAIAGATRATYALAPADRGHRVSVRVTGSRAGFETVTRTSTAARIAAGRLTPRRPKIAGKPAAGRRLTAKSGRWGPGGVTLRYRWYRDGDPIKRATKRHYRAKKADAGHRITVRVTGSRTGYASATRVSRAIRVTR
ncbi:filamentous hemagglutinin N-terminal domain-containing protein [Mumia zhuanghuii]|uniref:Filamentous hemagglutinin N-terminal domain-containing protein n=2 Tax=Mumia TaxID=1546255 RepID=A0ABW1QM33_9ACTN|nr:MULTISPECIES: filamentous hemagglutinin N-terminal domain-containing protein [Mumia]KAA1423313.1 filamentous hemagglutinin N-terminal domain-containing protein [Mumia zhuanghuii]